MLFTNGQWNELVSELPGGEQRLIKIISTKGESQGKARAAEELLKACQTIREPIIGAVSEQLKL